MRTYIIFFVYTNILIKEYWTDLGDDGKLGGAKDGSCGNSHPCQKKTSCMNRAQERGLNVPSLYVLLEYDVRFVLFQYHTCCTLWNRACQDIHLSHNWHSQCKDTMKIRHRKCREGNTVSSPWVECRQAWFSCLFYIQIKETILCCLPCISCDVFSSCLCIYCANCRPYTLQTWKSIEFETCWTLTADCIFLSTENTHKHIAHSLTGTFRVDVIIALINTIADSWAHWILWTNFRYSSTHCPWTGTMDIYLNLYLPLQEVSTRNRGIDWCCSMRG